MMLYSIQEPIHIWLTTGQEFQYQSLIRQGRAVFLNLNCTTDPNPTHGSIWCHGKKFAAVWQLSIDRTRGCLGMAREPYLNQGTLGKDFPMTSEWEIFSAAPRCNQWSDVPSDHPSCNAYIRNADLLLLPSASDLYAWHVRAVKKEYKELSLGRQLRSSNKAHYYSHDRLESKTQGASEREKPLLIDLFCGLRKCQNRVRKMSRNGQYAYS